MKDSILQYTLDVLKNLLAADSPTGFTRQASDYTLEALRALGYQPTLTRKGGVICCLNADTAPAENGPFFPSLAIQWGWEDFDLLRSHGRPLHHSLKSAFHTALQTGNGSADNTA